MNSIKLSQATRYKALSPKWIKYKDLYEGDHDVMVNNTDYLIPHPLELSNTAEAKQLLSARRKRTKYLKLVEMVVSIWTSILFRESPQLDDAASELLEQTNGLNDIDGEGTSFQSFIVEELAPWYLVFGDIGVLAESFSVQAETVEQEKQLGARPYLKLISPLQLVDWSKESSDPKRLGRLNFARWQYYKENERLDETQHIKRVLCSDSFRRDKATGQISIYHYECELDNDGNPKKGTDGELSWMPLGSKALDPRLQEIPLSIIQKESWIDGVCEETLRHFNYRSELDSNNHFQCYPSTFMFGVDPTSAEQYKLMSEFTITFVKDTDARVERLPAQDSAGLERAEANAINMVFKVGLDQVRSLPTDSKAVQGAETISEENKNLYTLLISTIDRLETLTNQALNNFALLNGMPDFSGKVTFNREIKEEDINQIIKIFNSFKDILIPIKGMREAMAEKLIPKMKFSKETTKELIDSTEMQEMIEVKPKPELSALDG